MNRNNDHQDLTKEERRAFSSLSKVRFYSTDCEEFVIDSLRSRGLIRYKKKSILQSLSWFAAAAAASVFAFLLGVQYGSKASRNTEHYQQPVPIKHVRSPSDDFLASYYESGEKYSLLDYRDEPDRPGNGDFLFSKVIEP